MSAFQLTDSWVGKQKYPSIDCGRILIGVLVRWCSSLFVLQKHKPRMRFRPESSHNDVNRQRHKWVSHRVISRSRIWLLLNRVAFYETCKIVSNSSNPK